MTVAMRRLAFAGLWLALVAYAAFAAPPDDPALTLALVRGSVTLDFAGVDASVAAVFSLLGVVPLLAATLLARDGARQRVPWWPFAAGAFALGAFSLLPYFALRDDRPRTPRPPGRARKVLASRAAAIAIVVGLLALSAWGVAAGHRAAYAEAFRTTAMVNVMTIDLGVCTFLIHLLVEDARRGDPSLREPAFAGWVRVVPLFGAAAWNALVTRDA